MRWGLDQQRFELGAAPTVAAGGERAQRVAVEALAPGDELAAPGLATFDEILARHLQRRFDGLRTAADEKRPVERAGRTLGEFFGQAFDRIVGEIAGVGEGDLSPVDRQSPALPGCRSAPGRRPPPRRSRRDIRGRRCRRHRRRRRGTPSAWRPRASGGKHGSSGENPFWEMVGSRREFCIAPKAGWARARTSRGGARLGALRTVRIQSARRRSALRSADPAPEYGLGSMPSDGLWL